MRYLCTLLLLVVFSGCESSQQNENTLTFLQKAKATGHVTITTTGAVSVGQNLSFFAGAHGTTVAFDGNIDFSDPIVREQDD